MAYIQRDLTLPDKSFILLGPRGTGKSTLIQNKLKAGVTVNLLISSQYLPLSQNPSLLRDWVGHLHKGQWVFIDEVQKLPSLLDEVHALYEDRGLHFALSGSSARKLRRSGANLLAGRALQTYLFPFIFKEFANLYSIDAAVEWGTLPGVVTDVKNRAETLATYVETYLKQELMEEGLIRKLEPFSRFLKVAGLYQAQVLNVENIAREAHIGRTTVDKYFEIAEDTLLGTRLPAIQLGVYSKEVTHPKFYFFDVGVARACAGLLFEPIDSVTKGFNFESYILHEVRAYNSYHKRHRDLFYYKVSGGIEVDLLVEIGKKTMSRAQQLVAVEIKYGKKWDRRWSKALHEAQAATKKIVKCYGVYTGDQILTHDGVTILPIERFLRSLYKGEIF